MGNIFGRFGGEQYLSQCLDNDGDGAYDTDRPRRRKQKYPRRPVLKTFEKGLGPHPSTAYTAQVGGRAERRAHEVTTTAAALPKIAAAFTG